jgi:hypothetical protein
MNLKKLLIKEAASKIIPLEVEKSNLGKKAKLAGILAAVAALVTALSNYMAG